MTKRPVISSKPPRRPGEDRRPQDSLHDEEGPGGEERLREERDSGSRARGGRRRRSSAARTRGAQVGEELAPELGRDLDAAGIRRVRALDLDGGLRIAERRAGGRPELEHQVLDGGDPPLGILVFVESWEAALAAGAKPELPLLRQTREPGERLLHVVEPGISMKSVAERAPAGG